MKTTITAFLFTLAVACSAPLYAEASPPTLMHPTNETLVTGTLTLQDGSKVQIFATQEELKKMQKSPKGIEAQAVENPF